MLRGKKINDMAVLFLIVGFCALRKLSILMYISEAFFLLCMLIRIRKKNFTIKFSSYSKFTMLFVLLALVSMMWAPSSKDAIKALKPLIQISVICICFADYLDDNEKIIDLIKYYLISSVLMVAFLLIRTPRSAWIASMQISTNASTAANRIGPSIGFQPNWLGMICAFTIVIWLFYLVSESKHRLGSLLMIAALMVIVIFTKSRKAILALFIGPIVFAMLYKPRKRTLFLWVPGIVLGIMVGFWAIFNVPFLYKMIGFRLVGLFSFFDSSVVADASVRDRTNMVKVGIELFLQKPLTGVGFGNFSYYYYHNYSGWAEVYAHNNYIEILADTGIVGFILYYFIPFATIYKVKKYWKSLCIENRKVAALIAAFLITRLIMDYGMVSYDDEFIQILTVASYRSSFLHGKH